MELEPRAVATMDQANGVLQDAAPSSSTTSSSNTSSNATSKMPTEAPVSSASKLMALSIAQPIRSATTTNNGMVNSVGGNANNSHASTSTVPSKMSFRIKPRASTALQSMNTAATNSINNATNLPSSSTISEKEPTTMMSMYQLMQENKQLKKKLASAKLKIAFLKKERDALLDHINNEASTEEYHSIPADLSYSASIAQTGDKNTTKYVVPATSPIFTLSANMMSAASHSAQPSQSNQSYATGTSPSHYQYYVDQDDVDMDVMDSGVYISDDDDGTYGTPTKRRRTSRPNSAHRQHSTQRQASTTSITTSTIARTSSVSATSRSSRSNSSISTATTSTNAAAIARSEDRKARAQSLLYSKLLSIPRHEDGRIRLPWQHGQYRVYALGTPRVEESWYTNRHIFPEGYICERIFTSCTDVDKSSKYLCEIVRGSDNKPLFKVTQFPMETTSIEMTALIQHGHGAPGTPQPISIFQGPTPSSPWREVYKFISIKKNKPLPGSINGPELCGIAVPVIQWLVQEEAERVVLSRGSNGHAPVFAKQGFIEGGYVWSDFGFDAEEVDKIRGIALPNLVHDGPYKNGKEHLMMNNQQPRQADTRNEEMSMDQDTTPIPIPVQHDQA